MGMGGDLMSTLGHHLVGDRQQEPPAPAAPGPTGLSRALTRFSERSGRRLPRQRSDRSPRRGRSVSPPPRPMRGVGDPPRSRVHRRKPADPVDALDACPRPSSSTKASVLRGCVRAPPRAPRAGRGVRPPAAGADAVRDPLSASGSPGPARPGAAPTRSPAATPRPSRPPRPRRRGRSLTASRGGAMPAQGPRGCPRAGSSRRGRPPSRRGPTVPRPLAPAR